MGLFRYEAVDKTGRVLHGAMDASDERQVADKLAAMGYSPRAVYPAGGPAATGQTQRTAAQAPPAAAPAITGGIQSVTVGSGVPVSIKPGVPISALARFFRHMATLVRSGMPLSQALNDMAPVVRNGRLRGVLGRMRESTQGGDRLSSLMAECPGLFPVHTIASVWAGEMAGRLEIALDEIAADLEQEAADTRFGRIGWGLTKINWLFFIVCFPISNMMTLLVPVLQTCLDSSGQMSTAEVLRLLLATYMKQSFWPTVFVCAAFCASWIVWGVLKRVPIVRYTLDRLLLYTPLWGQYHRIRARARFLHVMDGMVAAGISPDTAWDAASLTPRNSHFAEQLRGARARLAPDAGVSQLLAASGVFDMEDIGLVQSGERAGTVPQVLANLSTDYQERIASMRAAGRLTSTTILVTFGLLLSIYLMVRLWSSYGDLAVKAAEMVGQ